MKVRNRDSLVSLINKMKLILKNNYSFLNKNLEDFLFSTTSLDGAILIKPQVYSDNRGFFLETYQKDRFKKLGIKNDFIQDNNSFSSKKGVLRGLHFQSPPMTQAKLVRVTKGAVYDVIVDIRKKSSTFGKWEGFYLSSDNYLQLYIPRGFAHAFCTLEKNTEFLYKTDNNYSLEHEGGIIWNDPDLAIKWPIKNPILSGKDTKFSLFKNLKFPF